MRILLTLVLALFCGVLVALEYTRCRAGDASCDPVLGSGVLTLFIIVVFGLVAVGVMELVLSSTPIDDGNPPGEEHPFVSGLDSEDDPR